MVQTDAHTEVTKSWPTSWTVSSQGASPHHAPQPTEDTDIEAIESVSDHATTDAPAVEATVVPPVDEVVTQEVSEPVVVAEVAPEIKIDTSEKLLTPQIVAIDEVCGHVHRSYTHNLQLS